MGKRNSTLEKGTFHHEAPLPANPRHRLVRHCLIAPHECAAALDHPPEEILILAAQELRSERGLDALENRSIQQNVAGATFAPVDHKTCRICRAIVGPAVDSPPQ